jgi:RNA polymerase sigma factor (TIGR02999 family)
VEADTGKLTKAIRTIQARHDDALTIGAANALYEYLRPLASRAAAGEWHHESPATTEIIHGAFERLFLTPRAMGKPVEWSSRSEFLAAAAAAMKRLLIEEARKRNALKRGGRAKQVALSDIRAPLRVEPHMMLELAEALDALTKSHERVGRVIELRFFGGLTVEETASVLGVTDRTVRRDWDAGRLWLYSRLRGDTGCDGQSAE